MSARHAARLAVMVWILAAFEHARLAASDDAGSGGPHLPAVLIGPSGACPAGRMTEEISLSSPDHGTGEPSPSRPTPKVQLVNGGLGVGKSGGGGTAQLADAERIGVCVGGGACGPE